MAKLGLSSPWVQYYHKVQAFFNSDPEITVVYDEEKNQLKIYVENNTKAEALSQLIPMKKEFGTTTLEISVIPANNVKDKVLMTRNLESRKGILCEALKNNKSVVDIIQVDVFTNPLIYVIFKPEVIQYFTDSLGDVHGLCSTLNQEIAKDIFESMENVCYCTDKVPEIVTTKICCEPTSIWSTVN